MTSNFALPETNRHFNQCIVCGAEKVSYFQKAGGFDYWRCDRCQATFLDPDQRLTAREEFDRYRLHRNDPYDPGYRHFLSKVAEPLKSRLAPGASGLDYGSGPGPALACMLREAGHRVSLYDPFFFPDPDPLDHVYDFITCTETIEHFYRPTEEFDGLDRMLRPGGWLALMTCFLTDDSRFAAWHYRREETHVVFFREVTMREIAARFGWKCEIPVKDVALMQKN